MNSSKELLQGLFALPSFPVVLVTVQRNIMPAAAFHFHSFKPPSVMLGVKPGNLSCQLIREQGEFGINIPTQELIEQVQICGSVSGRDHDKFEKSGLTPVKGQQIRSYLISECPVQLECKLVHELPFGGSHIWFVGELKAVHINDDYRKEEALLYWPFEYRSLGEVLQKDPRHK